MNYNPTLIIDVSCMICLFTYFIELHVLYKRDNVIKAKYITLKSMFTAITIFKGILEMFVILEKLFSDCIATLHCGYKLYYCTFIHLTMLQPSISQLKLIICSTIDGIKSNFKDRTYIMVQQELKTIEPLNLVTVSTVQQLNTF